MDNRLRIGDGRRGALLQTGGGIEQVGNAARVALVLDERGRRRVRQLFSGSRHRAMCNEQEGKR
jgi:hypothetical protein